MHPDELVDGTAYRMVFQEEEYKGEETEASRGKRCFIYCI